jgi:Rne/Rng family ribonuclease
VEGAEASAPEGVTDAEPAAPPVEGEAPAQEVAPTPAEPAHVEARVASAKPATGHIKQKALEPLAKKRRRPESNERERGPREDGKTAQIQDLLKEGQEVIVQVVKDPIGTKGARVTCHISLPGRHLVFMPTVDHVGISRRIENERERKRLRELVDGLRPAGTGFIVRTVADGVEKDKLVADIKFLLGIWNEMAHKKDKLRAPALLHPDLDLILRSIRDLLSHDVEKLVIDDRAEYERIVQFVEQNVPSLRTTIEFYEGNEPIFDAYGIEQELTRALGRKVWLKSGGYLVIDQAEALVAIDINSGRFVGKKNLEETITAINVEASREIVYQLRLRNLGGVIIIDFIDMEKQPNREKVFKALQEALLKDRAKTNIVKISELGLVEMTRKRVRESVGRLLHEPCAICDGRGFMKSKATVAYEIFREVQRESTSRREDTLVISCQPEVAKYIQQEEREALRNLMLRFNKSIQIKPAPGYHQEQFEVVARWSQPGAAAPSPKRERQEKPAPLPKPPPVAEVVASPPAAADDDEGDDGDDEGDEVAATPAVPGTAPGQPPVAASGRRRRRRRRGRGGAAGTAAQSQAPAAAPRPPEGS